MRIRFASRAPITLKIAALAGLCAVTADAHADDARPRNARPGLTASVGVGAAYVNLGAQLAYLQPLALGGQPWTLFASAAFGRLGPGSADGLYLGGQAPQPTGAAFTLGASWGQRHRITADLGWGALASQEIAIEGLVIDAVARYGVFTEVGYEFLGRSGFLLRFLPFGIGYVTNPLFESRQRLGWQGSVGVGWKLW